MIKVSKNIIDFAKQKVKSANRGEIYILGDNAGIISASVNTIASIDIDLNNRQRLGCGLTPGVSAKDLAESFKVLSDAGYRPCCFLKVEAQCVTAPGTGLNYVSDFGHFLKSFPETPMIQIDRKTKKEIICVKFRKKTRKYVKVKVRVVRDKFENMYYGKVFSK